MGKGGGGSSNPFGGGVIGKFVGGVQGLHQDWTGVSDQAEAAGRAAQAAEAEARRQRAELITEGRSQQAEVMRLAQASPSELRAYEGSLTAAFRQNEQDLKLMDSIDPALMEASSQVLSLLKGESLSMGKSYESSRAMARSKLVDQLRAQYGPGAEASSIGQRALQDFDAKTAEGAFGMQQQSLGSLMGILQARPTMANSFGMLTQAGQNFSGIQNRMVGAQLQSGSNMLQAMTGGNQQVMNTVGSQYTEQLVRGRGQQQNHQTGVSFMSSMLGGGMGGGGK